MTEQPDRVNFCHLRLPQNKTVVSICYKREADGSLHAGFAFCSPLDMFNRSLGRTIAKGRMEKRPVNVPEILNKENGKLDVVGTFVRFLDKALLGDFEATVRAKVGETAPGNFKARMRYFIDDYLTSQLQTPG